MFPRLFLEFPRLFLEFPRLELLFLRLEFPLVTRLPLFLPLRLVDGDEVLLRRMRRVTE